MGPYPKLPQFRPFSAEPAYEDGTQAEAKSRVCIIWLVRGEVQQARGIQASSTGNQHEPTYGFTLFRIAPPVLRRCQQRHGVLTFKQEFIEKIKPGVKGCCPPK